MEVDGGDPSSVNKNPKVIKGAQEDAAKLDILVCGTCRNVFHFIEEFKEHKQEACPTSTFNAQETKPQVWAFLLWKSAIVNKDRGDGGPGNISSWKMYQRWCKMDEEIRENWIAAGRALQSFSMIASAKLQEVRTPNDGKIRNANSRSGEETDGKDDVHADHKKATVRTTNAEKANSISENWNNTSAGDNMTKKTGLNTLGIDKKRTSDGDLDKEIVDGKKTSHMLAVENDSSKKISLDNDDTIEIKEEKLSDEEGSRGAWDVEDMDESSDILCAPVEIPVAKKRSEPRPDSNKVTRRSLNRSINDGSSEDEYVVEKILAKRFNPKKKYYEYLLKWEGYPHEQNTWEPVHNMAACDKLVETFERNLAKQKAVQQAQQAQLQAQKVVANAQSLSRKLSGPSSSARGHGMEVGPGPSGVESSRPVRSSKKKALEQVKSWCGSMAKTTEFGKRKVGESSDSDEDDMSEKKVKLEPPDDDDDDDEQWSGGELQCSQGSSGEENVVAIQGNHAKVVGVIHKAKEHLFAPVVKRSPGRPRKIRTDEGNAINGMKSRKDDANDLAIKLGLESDSSPESKTRSPQQGNKIPGQPPVLVANSKGVIKVDPRQVPNLTSGVYIVANKSNVVKLESLPGSPQKGKVLTSKTPPGKPIEGSVKSAIQSGIVRKTGTGQGVAPTRLRPLAPAPVKLLPKPAPGQLAGVLLGGPGLMKVAPQLTQRTVVSTSPRSVTTTPRILGPRPTAVLQPRGTLLQSPLRPQTPAITGVKRPIGIPGVQTKITSAVRPRLPAAGKVVSPLTAQTKSGVKPIQAMLGKAVQGQSLASSGLLTAKKNGEGLLKPGERLTIATVKPGVRVEEDRPRKVVGRGRGRGSCLGIGNDLERKARDNKLLENDALHMEFHEVSSSDSESGDSLPELPMGELPSLEPESPPRPFTLCPETGKILSRAEGEPSPPPSPIQPHLAHTTTPTSIPVPTSGPTPTRVTKDELSGPAPGANESEEILPDKRESSPVPYAEGSETLLKVEMSPGGTTGTVIESSVADSQYVDTLRTEQGVTVTKIPAELGAKSAEQTVNTTPRAASPTAGKAGGGISVPARKLFMEGGKLNPSEVVTVTGEDGVVYQIATEGQDELEGGEGMQQCVYVTTDQAEGSEEGAVLTLDTAVAEAVAQLMPDQVNVIGGGCSQFYIKEGEGNPVPADNNEQLVMASVVDQPGTDDNAQVVAHVVQEGEIIPGTGKRRVVLLLPDGNLMMTDVDEEQYAALNLDK